MSNSEFKSIGQIKLDYLFKYYGQLPSQGTISWLNYRKQRIGGSEIGKLVYKKKDKKKKYSNIMSDEGRIFTSWGNNFEIVAKKWIEFKERTKIYEIGSIPSSKFPVAYSCDGLIIKENDLWLLEIKCPFMRNITARTPIKKDYKYQIQTGMSILPCDVCMFIEFKFRKCRIYDLPFKTKYDRWFHKESNKRSPVTQPLWYGALWWYDDNPIREMYISTKRPDQIYVSFINKTNEDFSFTKLSRKNKGTFIYFKCYYINKHTVLAKNNKKNILVKSHDLLWNRYKDIYNNQSQSQTITTTTPPNTPKVNEAKTKI